MTATEDSTVWSISNDKQLCNDICCDGCPLCESKYRVSCFSITKVDQQLIPALHRCIQLMSSPMAIESFNSCPTEHYSLLCGEISVHSRSSNHVIALWMHADQKQIKYVYVCILILAAIQHEEIGPCIIFPMLSSKYRSELARTTRIARLS